MADALLTRPAALARLVHQLPTLSATKLVAGMQKATRAVMAQGAVVITRHDEPTMVLMSVERYLELEQAARPDLDALSSRFDDMLARMQGEQAGRAMAGAFAMSEQELSDAALRAARR